MTKKRYFIQILILGSLTALAPFSIDMYLPGFPAIAKDLGTDVAGVGLSLSSFFIGVSAGQLLYGPLLDRYGRKRPLYLGLVIYILSSIACAYTSTIEALVLLRFIQAIGACAAGVASVAMVRDLFPVEENAKIFALLMLVVGTSPMIAPTVGGYVTASSGWHTVFLILASMGVLILAAVIFALPESRKPDPGFSLKPKFIINNFLSVLKEPLFYTYAGCGAISIAGLLTYVSGSPLLFMEIFKVGEKMYGWIFAVLSVGLIGASNLNTVMLKKYSSEQLIRSALVAQCVVSLALAGGTYFNLLGLYPTIFLIFLFLCCVGFVLPNCSALAMLPFADNAGSASSLMGAGQMGLGALTTVLLSVFTNHTAVPMTFVMSATALAGLLVFTWGRKMIVQF
jgi:DHA1 family bicyclomycin/chloramphenicol resistance-like MFS transporter